MKKRYIFGSAALALLATITLAACGSKTSSSGTGKNIKATITFVDQKRICTPTECGRSILLNSTKNIRISPLKNKP